MWSETILHSFGIDASTDGWASKGTVTIDAGGNLYTTVTDGGTGGNGAVVKLTPVAGGGYTEEPWRHLSRA